MTSLLSFCRSCRLLNSMKHQRPLLILFGLLIWINSCELFNQNDFIETFKIADIDDKELVCNLYQTGIDNYRYEFKIIKSQDTTDLFDAYLNDATANNSIFTLEKENEKMIIISNKPIGRLEQKVHGQIFILEGVK